MVSEATRIERFFNYVDLGGDSRDCWPWLGSRERRGYGRFFLGEGARRTVGAHRFAYELLVGPVPEGLELDHLCRYTPCVNPAHLEPVTHRENSLRGNGPTAGNAAKTHCIHGHSLADAYIDKHGKRSCRTCRRERKRHGTIAQKAIQETEARLREAEARIAELEGALTRIRDSVPSGFARVIADAALAPAADRED